MYADKREPRCVKSFEKDENTGTEVLYRCSNCPNCVKCKQGPRPEVVSIEQDFEQDVTEKGVKADPSTQRWSVNLPFVVLKPDN